ncbi:(2Fe-2S)-binding protein [Marinobacter nanhaiticus D15-8W]|uniref:(2Fe-2S)-binding protein n=1 Tax=Marinobacter nanhaiticus D15-8W TaxID=626887 RepID=N6WVZ2_9GAMM|nr:(2Fe-2S)-binding protein [Marinobacter nanhaiticus]ENO15192.1 (2Fe-2S)-binding protein [Marinobacter nanhaiticus D15-8W]BES69106.1 (2Fe-2S)-binding protein [Marinobacter nanhaiticus D15-8W]
MSGKDSNPSGEDRGNGVKTYDAFLSSRRTFLKSMGATGVAATTPTWASMAQAGADEVEAQQDGAPAEGERQIKLTVNGKAHTLNVAPNAILLDVLRERLGLTGTKKGCDLGQCGACTLHINGTSVNSCLSLAVAHDGDEITTVEGVADNERLHALQEAFWEEDAYQCGYCTSGQIMSALNVLEDERIPKNDAGAVREAMSGNICRCGAYNNILAAIQSAHRKLGGIS